MLIVSAVPSARLLLLQVADVLVVDVDVDEVPQLALLVVQVLLQLADTSSSTARGGRRRSPRRSAPSRACRCIGEAAWECERCATRKLLRHGRLAAATACDRRTTPVRWLRPAQPRPDGAIQAIIANASPVAGPLVSYAIRFSPSPGPDPPVDRARARPGRRGADPESRISSPGRRPAKPAPRGGVRPGRGCARWSARQRDRTCDVRRCGSRNANRPGGTLRHRRAAGRALRGAGVGGPLLASDARRRPRQSSRCPGALRGRARRHCERSHRHAGPGRAGADVRRPRSRRDRDGEELESRPVQLLPQALREETGVLVQQTTTAQASVFIRGFSAQRVVYLLDGVRFNTSTYRAGATQYLGWIDPAAVQRIEIVRGPSSVQYGSDAIGGVVNVLAQRPDILRPVRRRVASSSSPEPRAT